VVRADLSYEELIDYRAAVAEPPDFDAFWDDTITEARSFDLDVQLQPVDTPYRTVNIYDLSFCGFAGDRIKAWLLSPRQDQGHRRRLLSSLATTAAAMFQVLPSSGPAPATSTCSLTPADKARPGAAAATPRTPTDPDRTRRAS
jgi:hypothetical protein